MATIIKISKNQFRVREQSKLLRFDKAVETKLYDTFIRISIYKTVPVQEKILENNK